MIKLKIILLVLISVISCYSQDSKDLELVLSIDKSDRYILEVINHSNQKVKVPKVLSQDYYCLNILCVNVIGEVKVSKSWLPLKEHKTNGMLVDFHFDLNLNLLEIEPQKKVQISRIDLNRFIHKWFGIVESSEIRIRMEYILGKNPNHHENLKKENLVPYKLTSNTLELGVIEQPTQEHINNIYSWVFENHVRDSELQKSEIKKGAILIDRPKNGNDVLVKGLGTKKFFKSNWKFKGSFFFFGKIPEYTPLRVTVFESGGVKYYAITTQVTRFDSKNKSGKYVFNVLPYAPE